MAGKLKTTARWSGLILLALVFLTSGGLKLLDPSRFLSDVLAFAIPYPLAFFTAWWLPVMEVLLALALFVCATRNGALIWMSGLLFAFIGLLMHAEWRGLAVDCGCFGQWLVFPNLWIHLAFNTCLILLAAWLIYSEDSDCAAPR